MPRQYLLLYMLFNVFRPIYGFYSSPPPVLLLCMAELREEGNHLHLSPLYLSISIVMVICLNLMSFIPTRWVVYAEPAVLFTWLNWHVIVVLTVNFIDLSTYACTMAQLDTPVEVFPTTSTNVSPTSCNDLVAGKVLPTSLMSKEESALCSNSDDSSKVMHLVLVRVAQIPDNNPSTGKFSDFALVGNSPEVSVL